MWYEKLPTKSNGTVELFTSAYGELLADESIDEMDSFINKYYEGSFMTILAATTKSPDSPPLDQLVPQSKQQQQQTNIMNKN